jgi:hypothetical protein
MSLLDLIPGYSAAKLLSSHTQGEDVPDYATCKVTPEKCRASVVAAEEECATCVKGIMWAGLLKVLPLCGGGLVKGAAGMGIRQLAKSLAKAAAVQLTKSGAAAVLGPLGVGIAVLGLADVLVALYKALDIIDSMMKAKKQYCKCG